MNLQRWILLFFVQVIFGFAARRPGATFLLIPPTAKATGMAYAYTALCDDASANYYNAAGLAFLEEPKVMANYFGYLTGLHPDMHYLYLGAVYPYFKSGWGFDVIYFTPGKTEVRDQFGNYLGDRVIWRLALKINYSRKLSGNLSLGIGLKFINQYLMRDYWWYPYNYRTAIGLEPGGTGSSCAFDFNLLYKILPNLSVGTVVHNIGPDINFTQTGSKAPLPWTFRLGLAYNPVDNKYLTVKISTEITKVLVGMFADEEKTFWKNLQYEMDEAWKAIGLEVVIYNILSVRGGYFYDAEGAREGLTFGGGINGAKIEFDIGIDENIFDFETQNRKFSLSYTF